jgi:putative transposase
VFALRVVETTDHPGGEEILSPRLKGLHDVLHVIITETLKRYEAAKRELLPEVEHPQPTRHTNRAEQSHQPMRMRRVTSAQHAHRFLSVFGPIAGPVQPRCHRLRAQDDHALVQRRFQA